MVSFWLVEATVETPISFTELQTRPLQAKPVMFLHIMLQEGSQLCLLQETGVFHSGQGDCSGPVLSLPSFPFTPPLAGKIQVSDASLFLLLA